VLIVLLLKFCRKGEIEKRKFEIKNLEVGEGIRFIK
jgi:hypothetical protein